MSKLWSRLRGHFQEYVSRYAVLAIAVLTPASALLGELAGDLGGVDTSSGRAILAVASALGTAAAGVIFIRNLGLWQMLDQFGTAPGVGGLLGSGTTVVNNAPEATTTVTEHPDEQMGAAAELALPVSPDVDRPAEVTPVSPEQEGAV
jgi:hypothetical protein